jgi:hypothetical protein
MDDIKPNTRTNKKHRHRLNKKQPKKTQKTQPNTDQTKQKNNEKKCENTNQQIQGKSIMNPDTTQFILDLCTKIIDSITIGDNIAMLNQTSIILQLYDKDFLKQNKLLELQKRIDATLTNEKNMRILRMMQTIKTETDTRIEYYDRDVGSDERLYYAQEMEEEMIDFEQEIRTAVSKIIQELSTEQGVDTD